MTIPGTTRATRGQRRRVRRRTAVFNVVVLTGICFLLPPSSTVTSARPALAHHHDARTIRRRRRLENSVLDDLDDGSDSSENRENRTAYTATLSDIWFCLGCAFGWTLWMVTAHVKPDVNVDRYSTEGVTVRGHVLEAQVHPSGGNDGADIPTYNAVIDYMVENGESPKIQVRKLFQTSTLLEQGFANVELLVLPDDPTSGVLKSEWKQNCDAVQAEDEETPLGCGAFEPLSLKFLLGAAVVLLSIIGAFLAIVRLPANKELWGWISLVVGVCMLWPCAWYVHSWGKSLASWSAPSITRGVIIYPPESSQTCYPLSKLPERGTCTPTVSSNGSCAPQITTPKASNKSFTSPASKPRSTVEDEEDHGNYYICLPDLGTRTGHSDASSVSTISSASIGGVK